MSRNNVYNGVIQNWLKHLLHLKMDFNDSVKIMELLNHIEKIVDYIKTPFYVQVALYNGVIISNTKKPPYYTFKNSDDRKDFESSFNSYINQDEVLNNFDIIDVDINKNDYSALPVDLESGLTGIVILTVIQG